MTTDKYALHEVEYSVQGWDAILNADMQIIEANLHTRLAGVMGETIAQYDVVCITKGQTKYFKALANQSRQPALGVALQGGVLDDSFLIQRVGPITNAGWSFAPGRPVYLSASVQGGVTQVKPASGIQLLGIALSATSLLLNGMISEGALASTTTTTTTTTTTSSSTTTTT